MKIGSHWTSTWVAAFALAAMPAFADEDRSESWRELSAQWWQWALSIPHASNPVADATGASCMVGQRGPVWFLGGTVSGQPVVRSCSIPEGVSLFFPVVNSVNFNTPDCGGQPPIDLTVAELRALAAPSIDGATGLSVLLNNRPVGQLRRVRSQVFPTVLPQADLFSVEFKINCLVPGQVYSPSVDDGYYALLRGLPVGQHHLSIQGTTAFGFAVDVFYTLNVVKVLRKDRP